MPASIDGGDWPNVVPGQAGNLPNQDPSGWRNAAAATPNETHTSGDIGKGVETGSGRAQWGISAYKQFRLESFNVTNTPQLAFPNVQVGNQSFGIISGAGRPRNLQIGLKFIF